MPSYDAIVFTPQATAPATPAPNEVYYKDADDRLYVCPDGTGSGGGAQAALRLVPQAVQPTAARGLVYLDDADQRLRVCTAV